MGFRREEYATGGVGNKKDCSVRALAVAACISYDEAHEAFRKHGRLTDAPTFYNVSHATYKSLFPEAGWRSYGMSLSRFLRSHDRGHYVLHTRTHAFAVCDGVVHDWTFRPRCVVREFIRLA